MEIARVMKPRWTEIAQEVVWMLCALCVCAAVMGCQPSAIVSQTAAPLGASFPYHEAVLANGMRVITLEDRSAPVASVQLWYHVGSKDEQPSRHGFAHMFEHMMFQGTPRLRAAEHQTLIQSTGGDANAYTSFDQTVYTQRVPANQLELVMWLESERMAFLRIDAEGFATERKVVAEEYHKTAEQPYGTLLDSVLPSLFGGGTYSWSPIGDMAQLKQAQPPELQAFWETYYTPNNATLVVVGDIDHEEVQALAARYFGWIPRYPDKPPLAVPPAALSAMAHQITHQDPKGPVPIAALVYRTVPSGHADETALQMLGEILGGGESSRLYVKMVLEDQSAAVAAAGAIAFESDGLFALAAVLPPLGGDQDAALATLRAEMARIIADGPTDRELQRVKNEALRGLVTSHLSVESKAQLLGTAAVLYKDLPLVNRQLEDIRAVTPADIQRVARAYLTAEREAEVRVSPSLLGFLIPKPTAPEDAPADALTPAASSSAPDSWGKPGLSRPDALPDLPPVAAPLTADLTQELATITLPNGLRVVALTDHEVPFVTFSLGLRACAADDLADALGAGSIAAQMLTRGTAQRDYQRLSEQLAFDAVSLSASVNMDSGSVSAAAVTDQAPLAIAYLAEVVMTPTFPADQLDLLKDQYRTSRKVQESSPDFIADKTLRAALYGDHPYAREADPTLDQLDALTSDTLRAWWTSHVSPQTATLYIAGDLTPDAAFDLARAHFGAWTPAAAPTPAQPAASPPTPAPTQILLVDHPAEQSQIRVASLGITRDHPDYLTTLSLNHVFGGGSLESWLNKSIRGDKGLTYGAYGGFSAGLRAGAFTIHTFSQNDSVPLVITTILEQIDRLRTTPPAADELERAQRFITGDFVLSRETPQDAIADQWFLDLQRLPPDYFTRLLAAVSATTPADITRVAAQHIDPSRLLIVVVGPADALAEPLRAIAPVTVISAP